MTLRVFLIYFNPKPPRYGMRNWPVASVVLNVTLSLAVIVLVIVGRGAGFASPWDGPAVVTTVLTAATIVLAAVGVGVALLAVWGYTTLREHAGNIAREAAAKAADEAAERKVEALARAFEVLNPVGGEDVAKAYEGE